MITIITRKNILSELLGESICRLVGELDLINFLKESWDLENMPAQDSRGDNAEYDIWQHMINNDDMDIYDLFYDYFDLKNCNENTFLKFLESFVNPITRAQNEVEYFKNLIEKHLKRDNYYFVKEDEISKYPIYKIKYLQDNEGIKKDILLDNLSLRSLVDLITGDTKENLTEYKTRNSLELFFKGYIDDDEDLSFLSRGDYSLHKMMKINDNPTIMKKFLLDIVDERNCSKDSNSEMIVKYVNNIIKYDDLRLEKVIDKYQLFGGEANKSHINAEAHFKEIKTEIIKRIKNAKYIIWVIMAWFTDIEIYKELINKKNEGINVQIILNNDRTNNTSGLDYSQFEHYKIESWGWGKYNIEHQKVCIIDLNTVIHGSYNWTKNASNNNEEIEITENIDIATKYANRFMEIKRMQKSKI